MRSSDEQTPVDSRWIELRIDGEKVHRRTNHAAAIGQAMLYVYGGYDMELGMMDDLYQMALDQQKYVWRLMPAEGKHNPGPRRNHTLCVDQSTVYLFGGQINGTDSCNLLHGYDLANRAWQRAQRLDMPCLDSHCSFLHNGNMYIYGGYQAEYATYNDEIYVYEISTRRLDCLQQIGKRPLSRCSFSLSLIKNTFYVFGGCHETNLNDLWSFNLATCNWTEVFSTNTLWPEPRRGHSCCAYQNYLFLFGGIQTITKQRNDIYAFDLVKRQWSKVQENCNESYKLSENHVHTEQSLTIHQSSPPRSSYKQRRSFHSCKFNLTISSFGGVGRNSFCQFAQTSLYKRRGEPELFSAIRSKSTIVGENRRKNFRLRKEKMLSEFTVAGGTAERKLSPTSEAMRYSLKSMGVQHHRHITQPEKQLTVPAIRYDSVRSFLIGKKPCARDGQTAVVYRDYMVIFGGDRHMMSFNDIFLFRMDKALKNMQR